METRRATAADLPEIAALQRRWESAWFGAPEEDEDELRERFDRAEGSLVVLDSDRIAAATWWAAGEAALVVDPDADVGPLYAIALPWLAAQRSDIELGALSRDEILLAALTRLGWRHVNSSFELIRALSTDWVLAEPAWPSGVTVRALDVDDAPALHRLIYVESAWAEVPGHHERDFDGWREIFLNERTPPEQQVLTWRNDRLVGAALGRIFADGTGWVSQLAVTKDERGHGLGRALLLESLRRRSAGDATAVGLAVSQVNRGALALYLGVGLEIDREWMEYRAP